MYIMVVAYFILYIFCVHLLSLLLYYHDWSSACYILSGDSSCSYCYLLIVTNVEDKFLNLSYPKNEDEIKNNTNINTNRATCTKLCDKHVLYIVFYPVIGQF